MLKVLIIDDEYFIREGLRTIINWNSYGFEVCGNAKDGKEGLQKTQQLSPDLIIVDIKMPVMDGLQMVEELRKQGFDCKVIVLTAYPSFSFAQKFIELNIDSYVLKPIDPCDLIKKIEKIYQTIKNTEEIKHYMDNSISLSKDKIIEGLAIGNIPDIRSEKYNTLYGFDFPWKNYAVILIDVDKGLAGDILLQSNIKAEVDSFVSEFGYGCTFYIDRFIGALLKNTTSGSFPRILKNIQNKILNSLGISVTISLGETVDSMENIKQSYLTACKLMDKKFIYGHKKIIMGVSNENGMESSIYQNSKFDIEVMLEDLCNAVDVNNSVKINDLLEEIKYQFTRHEFSEDVIKINYTDIYLTIATRLLSGNETLKHLIGEKKDIMEEIFIKQSLQELHGYIKYKLALFSDELVCIRPVNTMKRILDYIDRNYDKDIKLETLASLFNYNSTYLGKLFKCTTGQYFNTYLDHVRIEKAKLLLGEGLKVYQVVERIGIGDIDYFYKKFKKYTGTSPSSFRTKNK